MKMLDVLPRLCCGPEVAPLDLAERDALAARFKALGDPTRVAIVNRLAAADEVCVCEFVARGGRRAPRGARRMTRVLFVCVQNAGRSQIGQALYERRGGEARSAGSHPADAVHEVVVDALEEVGIDVSGRTPKALTRDDVDWADLVVTMGCGDACPVVPGKQYVDWNLADPAGLCLEDVRELRATIEQRVDELPL